jgi:hypothetical protein
MYNNLQRKKIHSDVLFVYVRLGCFARKKHLSI